ncbi:hypothetical protein [Demequina iriomotensis]|uniref:hypothetical protein n=1 Tax=Demequina iriomotensis TaxID=1536641 RepID=UPI000784CAD9|nr:hypothetical protein [Demequina iriomotensis]
MTTPTPPATATPAPIRTGIGLAIAGALAMTLGAFAMRDAEPAAAAAADVLGAPSEPATVTLDAALDANVAKLEHFLDLGGTLDARTEGLVVLDTKAAGAERVLETLAADVVRALHADPALVTAAIADAGSSADGEVLATGTAETADLLVICTRFHGGMSLALSERTA